MSYHDDQDNMFFLKGIQSPQNSSDLLIYFGNNEQKMEHQDHLDAPIKQEYIQQNYAHHDLYAQNNNNLDASQRLKSRDRKKVFYRDKMAGLLKEGQYVKQEYKYVANQGLSYEQGRVPIPKQEQLKRNRESAKNSRQRKKQYITILQKKNEENMKLIAQLQQKLELVTLERDRLKEDNHAEIKSFYKSKAQAYQNLEQVIENPQSEYQHIQTSIQDMLLRFGTSGSERIGVINYYMNEIIQVLISDLHKYFLNSSGFIYQGITPQHQPKPIDKQIIKILDIDGMKIKQMMEKYRIRFTQQATVFKNMTQELYRIFTSIKNQGRVIELVFRDMMKEFDRKRLGQLILWFQEHKFSMQMKRVRLEWTNQLKSGEENHQELRKQTKHF